MEEINEIYVKEVKAKGKKDTIKASNSKITGMMVQRKEIMSAQINLRASLQIEKGIAKMKIE